MLNLANFIRQLFPPKGIMDVIKEIQGTFHPGTRGSDSAPQLSDLMPWQERPMEAAIDIVVENVSKCVDSREDREFAKSLSSFLVCSGTAGIGENTLISLVPLDNLCGMLRLNHSIRENALRKRTVRYLTTTTFRKG